nr:hypothetical protein Itr_chr13CG17540 [Ipomoea trifida]
MINEHSAQIARGFLLRGFETTATAYGGARSSAPLQDLRGYIETPPQIERSEGVNAASVVRFQICYSSTDTIGGFKPMINEHSAQIARGFLLRGFETTATAYGGARSSAPLQDLRGYIETPPQIERSEGVNAASVVRFQICYSSTE